MARSVPVPTRPSPHAAWWRYLAWLYESHHVVVQGASSGQPLGICQVLNQLADIAEPFRRDLQIFGVDAGRLVYWWGNSFEERALACCWIATLLDAGETLRHDWHARAVR